MGIMKQIQKLKHTLRNVTAGEGKETDFGYIIRVQFIY